MGSKATTSGSTAMNDNSNPQQGSPFQPGPSIAAGRSFNSPTIQQEGRKLFVGGIGNGKFSIFVQINFTNINIRDVGSSSFFL